MSQSIADAWRTSATALAARLSADTFDAIGLLITHAQRNAEFRELETYVRSLRSDFARLPDGKLRTALDEYLTLVSKGIQEARARVEGQLELNRAVRGAEQRFWQEYRAAGGQDAVEQSLRMATLKVAMSLPPGSAERRNLMAALRG